MSANIASVDITEHGVRVEQKGRMKCNYCGKVVSGSYRLKCHLGGIKGDVTSCEKVPESVKQLMENTLLDKKKRCLSIEVGELDLPDLPAKRTRCHQIAKPSSISATESGSSRHVTIGPLSVEYISFPNRTRNINEGVVRSENSPLCLTKRSIGRFFLETGIEFNAAMIPSLERMVSSMPLCGETRHMIPDCQEFKCWILQNEMEGVQSYVQEIRSSWKDTGCSILLDGWTDGIGRNLINVLVDCRKGTVYLHSFDISAFVEDIHAMSTFLEKVLEEVGSENVVQIISYSSSNFMQSLGRHFTDKHQNIFWTYCASHCIDMMLKEIGMMNPIPDTLAKAMIITRFIYNNDSVLTLCKSYTNGHDLVKPYTIKYAKPFVTLKNIMSEEDNLRKMFSSSEWRTSIWASNAEARSVTDLVMSSSFWKEVRDVLGATIPLVDVLDLMNKGDKQLAGVIYEKMDEAKERIKKALKNKKSLYMQISEAIDNIWNNQLHSHLHSAGYCLNPTLFYSSDFWADPEVVVGLLNCICRLAEGSRHQSLLRSQLDMYCDSEGDFNRGSSMPACSSVLPATWWDTYGVKCPELQKFAVRILSQSCVGGSGYALKRDLAEKLLIQGRNPLEQERLCNFVYLHYNMHLRNFKSSETQNISADEIDPMDDWIVYSTKEDIV